MIAIQSTPKYLHTTSGHDKHQEIKIIQKRKKSKHICQLLQNFLVACDEKKARVWSQFAQYDNLLTPKRSRRKSFERSVKSFDKYLKKRLSETYQPIISKVGD